MKAADTDRLIAVVDDALCQFTALQADGERRARDLAEMADDARRGQADQRRRLSDRFFDLMRLPRRRHPRRRT